MQTDAAAPPASWTGIADLVLTSPPYGLEVPHADDVSNPSHEGIYSALRRRWCPELYRIVNPDHGRACIEVPIDPTGCGGRDDRAITPCPLYADWLRELLAAGFLYRGTILSCDNGGAPRHRPGHARPQRRPHPTPWPKPSSSCVAARAGSNSRTRARP